MQGTVHVRVCGRGEELGDIGSVVGGRIGAEEMGISPLLLVFLLILDEGIALVGLLRVWVSYREPLSFRRGQVAYVLNLQGLFALLRLCVDRDGSAINLGSHDGR
jgi:hypothetical protein